MSKKLILGISLFFFCSCARIIPNRGYTGQTVDQCNFHVGQFGYGLRWSTLPVPLTIHQSSVNPSAISTILKVVGEWNQIWMRESGQSTGLFEVLGLIDYPHSLDVIGDKENTVTFVHTSENRSSGPYNQHASLEGSKFLQSNKQGVTQVRGRTNVVEADVFINEDDFDFFYEDENYLTQNQDGERNLASLEEKISFFDSIKNMFSSIFNFFFFWKKKIEREPSSERRINGQLVDFESLITHELGHVLGLGHNQTKGSIMNKSLAKGTIRRGLRPIELESLLCGYAQ